MSNTLIGWINYVKAASILALSSAPLLPPTNLANDSGSPSLAWQTASGVTTTAAGALLTIKPNTTQQAWDVIGLFRTNLTSTATVTFSLWNNDGTLVWQQINAGPVPGYAQVIALVPFGTVADFVQIGIDDAANPDNIINIPLCFAGAVWYPLGNASYASTVGRDSSVAEVVSRGGSEFPVLYYQRRHWAVTLDSLRVPESWVSCDILSMYSASGSNVLFIPDIASPYVQQEAIFGRLKPTADLSYPYGGSDRRRWAAAITERL